MPSQPVILDYTPLKPRRPFPWRLCFIGFIVLYLIAATACVLIWPLPPVYTLTQLPDGSLNLTTPVRTRTWYFPAEFGKPHPIGDRDRDWLYEQSCGRFFLFDPDWWIAYRAKHNIHHQLIRLVGHRYHYPLLFLHQRSTPAGTNRLVHVEAAIFDHCDSHGWYLCWNVIDPKPSSPTVLNSGKLYFHSIVPQHLYYGQPDPANPSLFTITCEDKSTPITFTCTLQNDDTLLITSPTLPATQPTGQQLTPPTQN